jgi:carotenoid cleavage dioxygenase-like enzyme
VKFPTLNDARTGLDNRYRYAVGSGAFEANPPSVVKYDVASMTSERHELAADLLPGEAALSPRPTRAKRRRDGRPRRTPPGRPSMSDQTRVANPGRTRP